MNHPARHHYGSPTPTMPALRDGKPQIKANIPSDLRGRLPVNDKGEVDADAIRTAMRDAPPAMDLPEPEGKCVESYGLRVHSDLLRAFDLKRDGLARGAYLRRILHWRWGA